MAYAVLYGSNGTKTFSKLNQAQSFAKYQANKRKENIEIDNFAVRGNFNQSLHSYVKPGQKTRYKPQRKKQNNPFSLW